MRAAPLLLTIALATCGGERGTSPPAVAPPEAHAVVASSAAPLGADASGAAHAPTPSSTGCAPLRIDSKALVASSEADTYTWSDAACAPRTAALLRNERADALGGAGGYLRRYDYRAGPKTRTCLGTGAQGWNGFGYVVSHFAHSAAHTQQTTGTHAVVLAGRHHAIHEYRWRVSAGGPVDVTVHWFFATGRDHPVYAITHDTTPAGKDKVQADARAPYGDLAYDGLGLAVDGVAWGDAHRFTTKGPGPVTPDSAWDYTQKNVIPFAMSWSDAADAEMGLVETSAWATGASGGDYGGGTLSSVWGKSGTRLLADVTDWLWPYQVNQWELPTSTTSHRLAWGTTYGAVGQSAYTSFGRARSGWPFLSYSVFVVLGTHTAKTVDAQISEMEIVQRTKVVTARGTLEERGSAGVARTDLAPRVPVGWDPTYAVWRARAASGGVTLAFTAKEGPLRHAVLAVDDWDAGEPRVALGGAALAPDVGYFATVDRAARRLWLTLAVDLVGTSVLTVEG